MPRQTPRPVAGMYYRHFKPHSSLYKVIAIAVDHENAKLESVIYKDVYSEVHYSRPMDSWLSRPARNTDRFELATRHDLERFNLWKTLAFLRTMDARHPMLAGQWDEAIAHTQARYDGLPKRLKDTE